MSTVLGALAALLILSLAVTRARARHPVAGEAQRRFRDAQEARRLMGQPWDVTPRRGDQ